MILPCCLLALVAATPARADTPRLGVLSPIAGAADIPLLDVGISALGSPVFGADVVLSKQIGVISPFAWETKVAVGTGGFLAEVEPAVWVRSGNFVRKGQHFGLRVGGRAGYGIDETRYVAMGASVHAQWVWHWSESGGLSATYGWDFPAQYTDAFSASRTWEAGIRLDYPLTHATSAWVGLGWPANVIGAGGCFEF